MKVRQLLSLLVCTLFFLSSCGAELKPVESIPVKTTEEVPNDVPKTEKNDTAEEVSVIPIGTTGMISLKVVSFNVNTYNAQQENEKNWHNRKDALCSYILSMEADVLCLQETPELYRDYFAEKFSSVYGYEHFNHNMTLYRKDRFKELGFTTQFYGTDPTKKAPAYDASMERNFTVTHLRDKESGAEFYAVATHFDHRGLKARIMAAKQLLDTFSKSEIPYILCGDFNTTEESYAYRDLTSLFLDAQKVAKTSDSGRSFNKWGKYGEEGLPIDFCFVCPVNITVNSYKILRDRWGENYLYSDHFPICVNLEMAY
ncbi:MAG: hypothetical protein E7580_00050 [Ruminococcaceae bacterium]|nr:hypothetical protein [Oscillospiraceae bacterium]